jgi:hypothetical protein
MMATANETIEGRITIDGVVIAITGALLTFGQAYGVVFNNWTDSNVMVWATNIQQYRAGVLLEGKSVKVEMRKTSNAGANTLTGRVVYAVRQ